MRFFLLPFIVLLIANNGDIYAQASNNSQGLARLHLEAKLINQTYCKDIGDEKVSVKLELELQFSNEGNVPIILYKHCTDLAYIKIRDQQPPSLDDKSILEFSQTIVSSGDPLELDDQMPNKHFTTLMPKQQYSTEAVVTFQLEMDENHRAFIKLPPGIYQLQITAITWPDANITPSDMRTRWKDYGYLWSSKLTSEYTLFRINQRLPIKNCSN